MSISNSVWLDVGIGVWGRDVQMRATRVCGGHALFQKERIQGR